MCLDEPSLWNSATSGKTGPLDALVPLAEHQISSSAALDVHHTYAIRTISVQYPYTLRTRSVRHTYAIRTPWQRQSIWLASPDCLRRRARLTISVFRQCRRSAPRTGKTGRIGIARRLKRRIVTLVLFTRGRPKL